jgi:hypothetical protein
MDRLPAWSIDSPLKDKLFTLLTHAKRPMSQDTITACVAMIDEALLHHSLVGLMLDGQVTATFTGSSDEERRNPDRYIFEAV